MKKHIFLKVMSAFLYGALIILLAACPTTATGGLRDSGPRKVSIEKSFPVKSTVYSASDTIISITVYEYSERPFRLIEKIEYDALNKQKYRQTFSYASGLVDKIATYDESDEMMSYQVIEHDSRGWKTKETTFNTKDSVILISEFTYNEFGETATWTIKNSAEISLGETRYTYSDEGLLLSSEVLNGSGELLEKTERQYEEKRLVEERIYGQDGELKRSAVYEYGSSIENYKKSEFDSNKRLLGFIEIVVIAEEEPRQVLRYYDKDGSLLRHETILTRAEKQTQTVYR